MFFFDKFSVTSHDQAQNSRQDYWCRMSRFWMRAIKETGKSIYPLNADKAEPNDCFQKSRFKIFLYTLNTLESSSDQFLSFNLITI